MLAFLARIGRLFAKAGAVAGKGTVKAAGAAGRAGKLAGGAAVVEGRHWLEHAAGTAGNLMYFGNQLLSSTQAIIGSVTNDFTHVITVEVQGGPKANIKRIWQLAVSAAFGKYRQGVNGAGDLTLSGTWDITGKSVAIQLHYTNKGLASEIGNEFGKGVQRFNEYREFFETGPSQELVGGDWSLWPTKAVVANNLIPANKVQPNNGVLEALLSAMQRIQNAQIAVAGGSVAAVQQFSGGRLEAQMPGGRLEATKVGNPLPDDGRVILTSAKGNADVQWFKPDTDYLIALVSASLHDPCVLPVAPPTDTMAGQKKTRLGYRVYPPGSGRSNVDKVNGTTDLIDLRPIILPIGAVVPDIIPGLSGVRRNPGLDGYAEPQGNVPSVAGRFNDPR